jgi:two-component system sensor histidine kinase KdpD
MASPGPREGPQRYLELASETTAAPLGRQAIGRVVGVLALSTALCALIAPYLHPINLSLIYMGGVFYIALRHGLKAALLAVLLAVLLFDWIFVEPRWSLKPTDPEYFFTFLITLGVGLAVSRLASQSRQAALQALVMAQHSQSLSLLSQSLARAMTPQQITHAVTSSIDRDLGAQASLILLDADGRLPLTGDDLTMVRRAERVLRGETLALACQGFILAAGGTPLGVLLVDGLPARHQGAGDLHLLQAYANQAAVAIERCRYAQRSEQAAIAAETERIRNTLLAGISHDFRTPLTAIIGAASAVLSQGSVITLEQRNALAQTVLDQATRLQSLTSDLLDMARLQEGRVRLTPEWCPAEDLVLDARAAVAGALDHHVLEFDFDPDDVVWCDATLLVQALANLLLNASQHSPAGSRIQLRIALTPGWWTLSVHDEGPGLSAGSEREVFQKFYRGPQGGGQGTGLGLAICDVVARLHGGRIEAHNDHGAVFELTLPQPEGKPELEEALHG